MRRIFPIRTAVLFIGDISVFAAALWASLFIRQFDIPTETNLERHLLPFGLLFVAWIVLFVVVGLYENRVLVHRHLHVSLLGVAQGLNVLFGGLFFFFIPAFGIAPKTVLVIYLLVSIFLIVAWRLILFPKISGLPRQNCLLVGGGPEAEDVGQALHRTNLFDVEHVRPALDQCGEKLTIELQRRIKEELPDIIVLDVDNPSVVKALPTLYGWIAEGVSLVSLSDAYEDVFGRVSMTFITDSWAIENISNHELYDGLKRVTDIAVAGVALACASILFPFIALAIKLNSRGPVFIAQERVGQHGQKIVLYKFRSMERNDTNLSTTKSANTVTSVGRVLRKTRLDELPQLVNIVRGDLSLVGPRPELASGVAIYEKAISHYQVRHFIKPGLSGWAQLYHDAHPHHVADVDATKEKLSYDLYYLKHRSFFLDVLVGLKTVRKVVTQSGA